MTIPRRPSDITPAWLGSVLGADVRTVDVTAIGTGQTGATYRVAAEYADSPSPTPPASFAVKLPAHVHRNPRQTERCCTREDFFEKHFHVRDRSPECDGKRLTS